MHSTIQFIKEFYERNLFERIIIYIFLSALIVKAVFEFGLGQWFFAQSQTLQWIFYSFLALEYLISWRKVINIQVTLNPMSLFALTFFIMVAHGLLVGILNDNQTFVIFNDAIPLLMIGLNILRMQSAYEYKPIDFLFLLKSTTVLAIGCCFFGYIALAMGNPSQPSLGNMTIYLPLLAAAAMLYRPFPRWIFIAAVIMIVITIGDINRTTMAFFAVVVLSYVGFKLLQKPMIGISAALAAAIILSIAVVTVPKTSQTYKRVMDLGKVDLSERTGSIGERQAEWDAINIKLENQGKTIEWLGLGFGGVYEVQFTHQYNKNYGHAHYSWAWYNLRFGRSGFIYLGILLLALLSNSIINLQRREPASLFIALLCLQGVLYCFTYVNSIFLVSGLHFMHVRCTKKERQYNLRKNLII